MGDVRPGAGADSAEGGAPTHLEIRVQSQDGDFVVYKVKPTTRLQQVNFFRIGVCMPTLEGQMSSFDAIHLEVGRSMLCNHLARYQVET